MLGGLVMNQHLAVVENLLAARPRGHDAERIGGVACDDVDIRAFAGNKGADVGELESAGGVHGDHLNGLDEGKARAQGEFEVMVEVSGLRQIACVQIVGDDRHHGGVDVLADDALELLDERAGSRGLAQHRVNAHARAVHDVVGAQGLMAGGHAGGHALVQVRALHLHQMTLSGHALHAGDVVERLHKVGEAREDVGSDAFGDADRIFALERLADDLGVE